MYISIKTYCFLFRYVASRMYSTLTILHIKANWNYVCKPLVVFLHQSTGFVGVNCQHRWTTGISLSRKWVTHKFTVVYIITMLLLYFIIDVADFAGRKITIMFGGSFTAVGGTLLCTAVNVWLVNVYMVSRSVLS